MKKYSVVAFLMMVISLLIAGCGGGSGGVVTAGTSLTPGNTVVVVPPVSPPTISPSSDKVNYLTSYFYTSGAGTEIKMYNYGFQQVTVGDSVVVGVKTYGNCQDNTAYYGSCGKENVPVIFRVTDANGSRIGSDITVVSNSDYIATTTIQINSIAVPSNSSKKITVTAIVEDANFINSSFNPQTNMVVNIVAADLVPVYSASTDQNVAVNIIANSATSSVSVARTAAGGMGYGNGTYASVRVKNTGNVMWFGFDDPLNRVYMVLDNETATSSQFFSTSWYSTQVVSDLGYYGSFTLPGDTTNMEFYLEANGVAPGKYSECFKLVTKPASIDKSYFKYALVDPVDITGSHFCLDITVLPESLSKTVGSEANAKPVGKFYWASKGF